MKHPGEPLASCACHCPNIEEFPNDLRQSWRCAPRAGRECRYTYVAAAAPSACAYTGLAKLDLRAASPDAAVAGRLEHGAGWFGGEASFVPRAADPAALKGACPNPASPLACSRAHALEYLLAATCWQRIEGVCTAQPRLAPAWWHAHGAWTGSCSAVTHSAHL